ncbi:MAG: hypothetical protein ABIH50_03370 [bacterium]
MININSLGAFGIAPFMSDDIIKQVKKFGNIKTEAGRYAYVLSLGKNAKKPQVKEGIYEARGALNWIREVLIDEK